MVLVHCGTCATGLLPWCDRHCTSLDHTWMKVEYFSLRLSVESLSCLMQVFFFFCKLPNAYFLSFCWCCGCHSGFLKLLNSYLLSVEIHRSMYIFVCYKVINTNLLCCSWLCLLGTLQDAKLVAAQTESTFHNAARAWQSEMLCWYQYMANFWFYN